MSYSADGHKQLESQIGAYRAALADRDLELTRTKVTLNHYLSQVETLQQTMAFIHRTLGEIIEPHPVLGPEDFSVGDQVYITTTFRRTADLPWTDPPQVACPTGWTRVNQVLSRLRV